MSKKRAPCSILSTVIPSACQKKKLLRICQKDFGSKRILENMAQILQNKSISKHLRQKVSDFLQDKDAGLLESLIASFQVNIRRNSLKMTSTFFKVKFFVPGIRLRQTKLGDSSFAVSRNDFCGVIESWRLASGCRTDENER